MKKLLISAAALALLGMAPGFAQEDHHEHAAAPHETGAEHAPPHGGGMSGPRPAMAPQGHSMAHQGAGQNSGHPTDIYRPGNNKAGAGMAGPNHAGQHNGAAMSGPAGHAAANFNNYHRNFTSPQHYHAQSYRRPQGWYAHRWTYGERLPPAFFVRDYWIDDFADYGLVPPPYGATWVRYGADALLIDEETGEVIQVVYGVFY